MLCQVCKETTATIHLTEITNGQRAETHLCQQCAHKQGLSMQTQMPLNELLSSLLSAAKSAQAETPAASPVIDRACPVCGMTLKRFSKESLLGCPADYKEFETQLMPLIERSQAGHTQHCGKTPSRTDQQQKQQVERIRLGRQLDEALRKEDYETAARLRDQIRQLQ